MSSIRYCAAWTECGCLATCSHYHQSVGEAVACVQSAGSYVVAICARVMRCLTAAEEADYQRAVSGHEIADAASLVAPPSKMLTCDYAVMTRIRIGQHWTWTTWMCFETFAEAVAHARDGDKVVRFRSAEWQALRLQTATASWASNTQVANVGTSLPLEEKTVVEFVCRLLGREEFDEGAELGRKCA